MAAPARALVRRYAATTMTVRPLRCSAATISRRDALAACGSLALAACAGVPAAPQADRIVDIAGGRELTRDELLGRLRGCDLALLGELHDNPRHHARRGELIGALGSEVTVLAEHLPRGRRVHFGADLRASLVDAGFDAKAWQWPMHEALFGAIARSGAALAGANAPDELVRRIAREGPAALPADLAAVIDAAPLDPSAQVALDADLVDGHCGHLAGPRLQAMRWAQRARDATMALALRDALIAQRAAGRRAPVVFVAGNGHVRSDYGVPQLMRRLTPDSRGIPVAFVETGSPLTDAPYACAWVTAAASRDDPCAGLAQRMRLASPSSAGSAPR